MKDQSIKCLLSALGIIMMVLYCYPALADNKMKAGMDLPDIMLEGTDCMERTEYLGVENDDRYMKLSKIPAKLMVIEFFGVYCPICEKQAPVANKLYKILLRNPDFKKDVKMIAIGIGSKQNEIDAYKQQHMVKFPMFIDPYSKMQKKHGISQIPYTVVINKNREVLYTHMGVIENLDEFLTKISEYQKQE